MANSYDRIFKENIEPLQLPLLAKLLGLIPPKLVAIDAKMQVTQEAEMDSIRRVAHPDAALDYGLQIEFHIVDEDLRWRNLLHYGLFYQITRLPLRQIVIYGGIAPPKKITGRILELSGLRLEYEVIVLKDIPKEVFINSEVPEEVVLAVLCDYGADKPEAVVRIILQNLKKILRNSEKIRKFQKQLLVLSRLRKIELVAQKEIEAMNIHYDIETDGLYLQGIEKGLEKGIELEREEKERQFTLNLWKLQEFSLQRIADLAGTSERRVAEIITDYLQKQEGKTQRETESLLRPFRA
jgi:hypothetical protein